MNEELIHLEEELLRPHIRQDQQALDRLLSEDFLEIGASGRRYGKEEIMKMLPQEIPAKIHAFAFETRPLAAGLVQLIYQTAVQRDPQPPRRAVRSSIWQNIGGRWQIIYHQGTLLGVDN